MYLFGAHIEIPRRQNEYVNHHLNPHKEVFSQSHRGQIHSVDVYFF